MLRSMTGFGRSEVSYNGRRYTVEVRAVNHRYLELAVKLPRVLSSYEPKVRSIAKEYLERGKVDIFIGFIDNSGATGSVCYNEGLARQYMDRLKKMASDFDLEMDIRTSTLARFPDVLSMEDAVLDSALLWQELEPCVREALSEHVKSRETEGEKLKADLLAKIEEMSVQVQKVEERAPAIQEEYREKLKQKMQELLGSAGIDETRIAMEAAVYADKSCIDEELVRLKSHIGAMAEALRDGGSVGRRLDFIAQEMNREANTTLSKVNDLFFKRHCHRYQDGHREDTGAGAEPGVIMSKLINIGFGNIVNADKIIAIVTPDSAPAKRLMQNAKKEGTAIDATHGRKIKAVMVMENNQVVFSALLPETLLERFQEGNV